MRDREIERKRWRVTERPRDRETEIRRDCNIESNRQANFSGRAFLFYSNDIQIRSIGMVTAEDNIRHTEKVTKLCNDVLDVPSDKVRIILSLKFGFTGCD